MLLHFYIAGEKLLVRINATVHVQPIPDGILTSGKQLLTNCFANIFYYPAGTVFKVTAEKRMKKQNDKTRRD